MIDRNGHLSDLESHCMHAPGFWAATLCEAFQMSVSAFADAPALRVPGGPTISWREYAARVRRLAGGLAALGVGPGDTVGLMLVNRPEFHLLDTAIMHLGAIPFSVHNTSTPEQLSNVFRDAGNRLLITEERFADSVWLVNSPSLARVVVLEQGLPDADDPEFETKWRAVAPDASG
jgi:long-chain acyl-CoA synthetase